MKKTIFNLLIACFCIHGFLHAQEPIQRTGTGYTPVYYNFHKRLLRSADGDILSGVAFLAMCREIPDSAIQVQVARYDNYTRNKAKLGLLALTSGATSFVMFGLAINATSNAPYSQSPDHVVVGTLVGLGIAGILTVPIAAFSTAMPHQRRKAILFHDLPIAYNQYVESLTPKN